MADTCRLKNDLDTRPEIDQQPQRSDAMEKMDASDCEGIPFEVGIETITWTFPNGDCISVEKNTTGYFISGRIAGKDWHDEDHEDFFCADTEEYLEFLEKHGLLGALSVSPITNDLDTRPQIGG